MMSGVFRDVSRICGSHVGSGGLDVLSSLSAFVETTECPRIDIRQIIVIRLIILDATMPND
jgi:hypothetical protein